MGDLRTRIAAVLGDNTDLPTWTRELVADMLIRELNRQNLLDNPVWKWLVLNEPVIAHRYMSSLS